MAIIKHIAMRSSNYAGAIDYLIFEHDGQTQKMLLDEYGVPVPREDCLFEGINCDPWAYDYECHDTNNAFNKNQSPEEVKQHHYIISFDPADARDHGLTPERAQEVCMGYAKRNFPGFQAIVCTHADGHSHSGNIHTHIVFNSLRKHDVDEQPFMERSIDHMAGYKYHETKKMLAYLKSDLMETCRREGLYQVDLLKRAGTRVTDREYYARGRMQAAGQESRPSAAAQGRRPLPRDGQPSADPCAPSPGAGNAKKPSAFELQKDYLRRAIDDVKARASGDSSFASLLQEEYGIRLTVSRGKWGYLHPDRKRPVRGRKLGADYEEAALRKAFPPTTGA